MKEFKLWDLDTPYLYSAVCTIKKDGKVVTQNAKHFGMRKFVSDETTTPKTANFSLIINHLLCVELMRWDICSSVL